MDKKISTEEKIDLLMKSLIMNTIILAIISLASLTLVAYLYPPPFNIILGAFVILLAIAIYSTMRQYTAM